MKSADTHDRIDALVRQSERTKQRDGLCISQTDGSSIERAAASVNVAGILDKDLGEDVVGDLDVRMMAAQEALGCEDVCIDGSGSLVVGS
jgi:hypothetical protein